jgi:molybdenum cofactor guanylyltransferase
MPPDSLPIPAPALRRVVVLAGGGSRRLGRDKLVADLGGGTVLAALLQGLRSVVPQADVVLVGPLERSTPGAHVVQEDPPGGGPVAGLAAGLAAGPAAGPAAGLAAELAAGLQDDELVAVLAGDQPFAAAALPVLTAALTSGTTTDPTPSAAALDLDGAVGVDAEGRDQPLLAVYRTGPLRRALADLAAGSGLPGARVRDVVTRLSLLRVVLPETAALDVDTPQDLERARAVVRQEGTAAGP